MKNAPLFKRSKQLYCKKCLSVFEPDTLKVKHCLECGVRVLTENSPNLMNLNVGFTTHIGYDNAGDSPIIKKIGIEMEGQWARAPLDNRTRIHEEQQLAYHDDGSVHFSRSRSCSCCRGDCSCDEDGYDCCEGDCTDSSQITGEYVTKPIVYYEDLRVMKELIMDNYPTNVNASCGGHFHLSFKSNTFYGIAMDRRVWLGVKREFKKWIKTNMKLSEMQEAERRLNGIQYCANSHNADNQVYARADRYTQFNFSWQRHQTMEVRLLPMFKDSKLYMKCVRFLCNEIQQQIIKIFDNGKPEEIEAFRDMSGRIKPIFPKLGEI
jgi:hypothetical protein|tara:strand:+ start:8989 stop:9954 length:966 start_codon:yes stop_codon:yes gene_type:complete